MEHPDLEYDSAGNLKPSEKYLSPPSRSNMLCVLAAVDLAGRAEPTLPKLNYGLSLLPSLGQQHNNFR